MQKKETGYIEAIFTKESKQKIIDWATFLKEEDLFSASINGKVEGGDVTDTLHLTLFYGFDEKLLNQDEMLKYINTIKLNNIQIEGVGTFPVPDYGCKVLFLKVKDEKNIIKNIHKDLKKFPHYIEHQKLEYKPHITIAYVKNTFDSRAIIYNESKSLLIEKIMHSSKEFSK